jgi:hypothetical protein
MYSVKEDGLSQDEYRGSMNHSFPTLIGVPPVSRESLQARLH